MKDMMKIKIIFVAFFCLIFSGAFGQEELEGTVLSRSGEVLKNVQVSVKENPAVKERTDDNGNFLISADANQLLVFEYKNTVRKVIRVSEIEKDNVIVLDDASTLVNVGYDQTVRKEEIVSSVGFLSKEKIEKVTAHDLGNTLFGQISGLRVFQNTGNLPDDRIPSFNIRGQATTQDNSILILIDGVERPINSIVPEEIESVSVLRDAGATARYGQRGANGVLLINTKRGSFGKTKMSVSFEQGITEPTRTPKFLDAAGYARAENEARINDGIDPKYSQMEIDYFESGELPEFFPNVNWMDEVLSDMGQFSRFNLNFSGGSDLLNYFVSMNYQNEEGLFKHTDLNDDFSTQLSYDKVNLRVNMDMRLTPTMMVYLNSASFLQFNQQPATPGAGTVTNDFLVHNEPLVRIERTEQRDIVADAFSIPSAIFPVKNFDGTWGGTREFGNNPVAELSDVGYDMNHIRSFGNDLRIVQDLSSIVEGLSAEVFGSIFSQSDYWENKTKTFNYFEVVPELNSSGQIIDTTIIEIGRESDIDSERYSGSNQLTHYDLRGELRYSNTFGDHSINSWALFQTEQMDYHQRNQVYRNQNFAGNLHYGFANKYFLDGTISYYGTNRIQEKSDRFGVFPAIAGAWLISNESFMEDVDNVNVLKLNASYGKVGNGRITIWDLTHSKYGGGSGYVFGHNHNGVGGTQESNLGIPQKKFESSYESNVGIEVQLFDKLDFRGELFNVKRKDIFVSGSGYYSTVLGISPGDVPEGEVENKGYELDLTWSDQIGDFSYFVNGRFSQYQNKIINMNEEFRPHDYLKREGESIGQYFGWESDGFFSDENEIESSPTQQFGDVVPGDIKYVNQNSDEIIDDFDEKAIGNSNFPEIYYSASLGLGFKGFQISALMQGTERSSVYLSQSNVFWPLRGNDNISTWYENYWTSNNQQGAELPRLSKQSENNYRRNDIWIRDNSFLKLRYVELSYSLPKNFLANYSLDNIMIYLRGRDLFSIDTIEYVDPENVNATYPSLSSYNVGIKVQF